RILCCDDKKWLRQFVSHAIDRDVPLLHRLEQRALRFGSGAIDFVDQYDLRKERATMKNEPLLIAIENGIAENVGREEIACELDALKGETKRTGERLRECRLANAGNVFNKQMTAGKQTRDRELYRLGFADDDLTYL